MLWKGFQRIRRWRGLAWKNPESLNHYVEESYAQIGMPVYILKYTFFSFSFLKLPELQDPFVTATGINPTDTYV